MNEFLEQFLLEARELAEQAAGELLTLEKTPDDSARLDSAFRAFHTLKGGAGIVDFTAMSRAVHAAEGALSAVRSGDRSISPELISDCLAAVDQVVLWLDEIQATGDLPAAPDKAADAVIARFGYEADPARRDEVVQPAEPMPLSDTARRILDEQLALIAEPAAAGREGRVTSAARVAANVLRHASMDSDAALAAQAGEDELADIIARALGARRCDGRPPVCPLGPIWRSSTEPWTPLPCGHRAETLRLR